MFFFVFAPSDGAENAPRSTQDAPKTVLKSYFFDVQNCDRFWCDLASILGAFWEPFWLQKGSQNQPNSCSRAMAPPRSPKKLPRGPKRAPKRPQEAPSGPQEAPKARPRGPRTAQELPKSPQEDPRTPKSAQERPTGPFHHQTAKPASRQTTKPRSGGPAAPGFSP